MAAPAPSQFYRPTLEIAAEATGDGFTHKDFIDRLIPKMQLTEDDLKETVSSGKYTKVDTRAHFARTNLKSAGLMDNPRHGYWQITAQGRDYLSSHTGPIPASAMKQMSSKLGDDSAEIAAAADDTEAIPPIEQMANSHQQLQATLSGEILDKLKGLEPDAFERLVVDLLEKMGYGDGQPVGRSGDGGIDGVINEDTLGLEKIYIQAKKWDDKVSRQVGEPEIRNFSGSLDRQGAIKGVFITTSTFSPTARQSARDISMGNKFIRLIDGRELAELMIRHGVGVVTEITYAVKKLDANYFAEV